MPRQFLAEQVGNKSHSISRIRQPESIHKDPSQEAMLVGRVAVRFVHGVEGMGIGIRYHDELVPTD